MKRFGSTAEGANGRWISVNDVQESGGIAVSCGDGPQRIAIVGSCRGMSYFNWLCNPGTAVTAIVPYLGLVHPGLSEDGIDAALANAHLILCEPHFNFGRLNHDNIAAAYPHQCVSVLPGWNNYRLLKSQQVGSGVTTEQELVRMLADMSSLGASALASWVRANWRIERLFYTINHPTPLMMKKVLEYHCLSLLSAWFDYGEFYSRVRDINIFEGEVGDLVSPEDNLLWK